MRWEHIQKENERSACYLQPQHMNTSSEEDISFQGVWICSSVWSIHLPGSNIQAVAYEMQCISGVHSTAWCQRPSRISHPRSAIILEEIHCLVGLLAIMKRKLSGAKGQTFAFIGISDKVMASLMDNQKVGGVPSLQDVFSGFKGARAEYNLCVLHKDDAYVISQLHI